MTIQLDIDNQALADLDEALGFLHEDRDDVVRAAFAELVKKKKREAEVARQYAESYAKHPIQPDEFEIEEEQLIEVWKDL